MWGMLRKKKVGLRGSFGLNPPEVVREAGRKMSRRYLFLLLGGRKETRRHLTTSQISVALRPFYFLVHPDLFGKYPEEQKVNESSLKTLKSFLETRSSKSSELTFFVKSGMGPLSSKRLHLDPSKPLRSLVSEVLTAFHLPTSYVDSLTEAPKVFELPLEEPPKSAPVLTLQSWLESNVERARFKLTQCIPARLEIERMKDDLMTDFHLSDIIWDCDLNALHRRGTLDSLRTLAESHSDSVSKVLKGKNLIFGRKSGTSLKGDIVLFSGDIRYNWLKTIKKVPEQNEELQIKIPLLEKILSETLRNMRVSHREFHPLTLVEDHRARLRKVLTAVNDRLGRGGIPEDWPGDLCDFKLCVESEASPLMIAPSGEFVVPASTPGFLLFKFIGENLLEAKDKLAKFESKKLEEREIILKCREELGLIQLDKDDSIIQEAMIDSCQRLLDEAPRLRHLTHGNHFIITRYYSVQSDGSICLPFNWISA